MTREEVREYQLAQLELIKKVDDLCSQLNVKYYLIGGTLLGAIRHQGFIPWDPDIDIAMPRSDYEKFRMFWNENSSERYFYQHYSTEKYHTSVHARLRLKNTHVVFKHRISKYTPRMDGIYLDIFPLDNAPSTKKEQAKQARRIRRIARLIELKGGYVYPSTTAIKKLAKKMLQLLLLPFSFTYLNKKMDKEMRRYDMQKSDYMVSMASHYSYWKQLIPTQVYGEPVRVAFEGLQLCVPAQADNYLKQLYKDYMKLPPERERWNVLNMFERIEYDDRANGDNGQ